MRILLLVLLASPGCRRTPTVPSADAREQAEEGLERFRAFALEPARLPPPSIDPEASTDAAGLTGIARVIRPEEAPWNRAPDGSPVLFNDRWAWLVQLELRSEGGMPLSWVADQATLELNDPDTVLRAAPLPDDVLGDLLFWALQQERSGVPGDLVARTRAAGGFRSRYLPRVGSDGSLDGLVAFPAMDAEGTHVVAARLKVPVVHNGATTTLVWVFD